MTDADDAPKRRTKATNRDPAFDMALGARIQAARIAARMSQGALGAAIGVSFQQVQKYERGKDRISAGMLAGVAAALGVHPGSFFTDDAPAPSPRASPGPRGTLSDLRSAQRIGERIERVGDPNFARKMMALADAVADARQGEIPNDVAEMNGHAPDDIDP